VDRARRCIHGIEKRCQCLQPRGNRDGRHCKMDALAVEAHQTDIRPRVVGWPLLLI